MSKFTTNKIVQSLLHVLSLSYFFQAVIQVEKGLSFFVALNAGDIS